MKTEIIDYKGWEQNTRLSNSEIELVITREIGPRIIRFAFIDKENIFGEMPEEIGKKNESEWMIRGGHRFWMAPEQKPETYELDNKAVTIKETSNGVEVTQPTGEISGTQKTMLISIEDNQNTAHIKHTLTNVSNNEMICAPWALSVMAKGGKAIIPLPKKIPHPEILTHTQNWSLWSYTDFSDSRWRFLKKYVLFHQQGEAKANKVGIAHKEFWVAYQKNNTVFTKRFEWQDSKEYPDGGVNFETFANDQFLEMESLGPLVKLMPGHSTTHKETWSLHKDIPECNNDTQIDKHILPLM
jgi:hypothetical protein